jgi:hypothetical protein
MDALSMVLKNQRTQEKNSKELVKEPILNYWFFASLRNSMEIFKTPELEVVTKSKNRLHTGAGRPALNLMCL